MRKNYSSSSSLSPTNTDCHVSFWLTSKRSKSSTSSSTSLLLKTSLLSRKYSKSLTSSLQKIIPLLPSPSDSYIVPNHRTLSSATPSDYHISTIRLHFFSYISWHPTFTFVTITYYQNPTLVQKHVFCTTI